MNSSIRLRTRGILLLTISFLAATAASWMWFASGRAWQDHLTRSYISGIALYESLRTGAPSPEGIVVLPLGEEDRARAMVGDFTHLSDIPTPPFVTNVSIIGPSRELFGEETLALGIISGDLRYSVSELVSNQGQSVGQKLGNITRLLATYCSNPIVFGRLESGEWLRIDGTEIWGCDAAPRDLRLPAVLFAIVVLAILSTLVLDTSAHFDRFARALRNRRRLGGPESYTLQGPEELREITQAVNSYLEAERDQLVKRATVLSGVSHDLGTPATRLRLRTALIQDDELREKLETDIDSMTKMIDSVLTYTRAEMNAEEPRQISLTSLVESIVADYQDLGKPVELRAPGQTTVTGGQSVFGSMSGQGIVPDTQKILITARPVSLTRAISNLIENALKYGRRASVELSSTAEHATITVEDEGSGMCAEEIEAVVAPFKRGENTQSIKGFGLGLTIVASVADQHGGKVYFEDGRSGLRACVRISRT